MDIPTAGLTGSNVCFSTCVDNGELSFRDCGLNPNNFTLEPDGSIILDWSVASRTARAGRVRHYNVMQDTSTQRKLTNLTTAHVERSLVSWNATAHSTKQGALRRAAPIVETCNLDPHVILQLACTLTVRPSPEHSLILGRYTTMLTQVSSLLALM
ncbi:hypothetical protein TcBrA4_0071450 [Trypanosoma cruzi]|nr:hypothetical protein TcBrA4_0071450 [Trypanosoma cruzi]